MEGSIHPGPAVGKLHPPGRNHIGKEMAMNASTPIAQGHSPAIESPAAGARRQDAPGITAFRGGARSRGFTLIEMLVSLAITLIMMGAVVTLFGVISESVSGARSAIEMADRLRGAREQLQLDLQGVTATMTPPLRPEMNEGYFEIIEGPSNDDYPHNYAWDDPSDPSDVYVKSQLDRSTPPDPASSWVLFGDTDDVLMFTTRNRRAPFLGKLNGTVNESTDAEVIYFLVQDGPLIDTTPIDSLGTTIPTRLCTLYRRVLLVSPSVGPITVFTPNTFYANNDLSVRFQNISGTNTLVPNTLGDLTKRECRFAHNQNAVVYPFLVDTTISPKVPFANVTRPTPAGGPWPQPNGFVEPFVDTRLGDDVLLTNVLSFDVRVFDLLAPLFERNSVSVEPGDPAWGAKAQAWIGAGFPLNAVTSPIAFGAYCDLGYFNSPRGQKPLSPFDRINPNAKFAGLTNPPTLNDNRIYDTWSLHYENDGIDQFGDGKVDLGTNGLDDNANGIVDDNPSNNLNNGIDDNADGTIDDANEYTGEFETLPPYPAPLRGIKVTIRVYEPSSQTVREAVVIQNFDTK
jgi:prepilin-type N-terminal cleavage/methylation domain-containing protein